MTASALLMTASGDLDISTRNVVITKDVQTVTLQEIRGRLLFFQGEWFGDTRIGFPWIQMVFGVKGVDLRILKQLMRKALLSVKSVSNILSLDVTFDPPTRSLSYTWSVQLNDGSTLESGPGTPFVLNLKNLTP